MSSKIFRQKVVLYFTLYQSVWNSVLLQNSTPLPLHSPQSPTYQYAYISLVQFCTCVSYFNLADQGKNNRVAFRPLLCLQYVSVIYCSGFDSECVTNPKPILIDVIHLLTLFLLVHYNNDTCGNLIYKVILYNQGTWCYCATVFIFPKQQI